MAADHVLFSFLYVEDSRPVLIFNTKENAHTFISGFKGRAETYGDPTHVFLNKPHGLELVRPGKHGDMAYVFHHGYQAEHWAKHLGGYAKLLTDTADHKRIVFLGRARS
jgi:hypothetical protein